MKAILNSEIAKIDEILEGNNFFIYFSNNILIRYFSTRNKQN